MPKTRGRYQTRSRLTRRQKGGDPCFVLVHAVKKIDVKKVRKLVQEGVSPECINEGLKQLMYHFSLDYRLVFYPGRKITEIAKILIDNGANVNLIYNDYMSFLGHAVSNGHFEIVKMLVDKGASIELASYTGGNFYVFTYHNYEYARHIEIFKLLLEKGLNINVGVAGRSGYTFLHHAVRGRNIKLVRFLLENGADKTIENAYGKTPLAEANEELHSKYCSKSCKKTMSEIINLLDDTPLLYDLLFQGWSRETIRSFNAIFQNVKSASDYSFCPICLDVEKQVIREDGCMYMKHICNSKKRDDELWKKYKDGEGYINWCTICGRICIGHSHYPLNAATDPKLQPLYGLPGQNPFDPDCRLTNGGGGLPEKYTRLDALRTEVLAIQELTGQITERQAKRQLVEAYFNGPLRYPDQAARNAKYESVMRTIPGPNATNATEANRNLARNVGWTVPANEFRQERNLQRSNNVSETRVYPNIPYPNANNAEMQPVLHASGENFISAEDDISVIQFRHRQVNGVVNLHEGKWIGKDMLVRMLGDAIRNYEIDPNLAPRFGLCIDTECTAKLYPAEVNKAFELLGALEDTQEMRTKYRALFNQKFAR